MRLTQEEQDLIKNNSLEITQKIYDEIKLRFDDGAELKNLSLKDLLSQFSEYMKLLKMNNPKLNFLLPIPYDPEKESHAKRLFQKKLIKDANVISEIPQQS